TRSVLASPGRPSTRTCPRMRSAITRRSMIACCPTMTRAISARSRSIVSWAAAIWALTVFWSIALQFILRRKAPKDLRWHSGLARRALLVACASLCHRRSFASLRIDLRPKKYWGQNFLRNRGAVEKIVAAIEAQPDDVIVEIGPGEGVLTEKLAILGNELTAIDIDPDLSSSLQQRFGNIVVNADALTAPLPARPFRAVGNLPYNVGTPILRRIVADPNGRRAVF